MEDLDCVVSLTSWKGRIYHPDVPKVIYSIIRQKTQYKFKVVLVLSTDEFPNKEEDLPENIRILSETNNIEILWLKENLKAFKKYYATHLKYKNVPIMTTDDDILLHQDCIETFMNNYKKYNCIIYEDGYKFNCSGKNLYIGCIFRLFPPNSMLELDKNYFIKFFNCVEDDAYISLLVNLKNTEIKYIHSHKMNVLLTNEFKSTALYNEYKNIDKKVCISNLLKELHNV